MILFTTGGTDAEEEDLAPLLKKALAPVALGVLRAVGDLAASRGVQAYLVGGVVRDLLLGRETHDLDVSVEGDACGLARALAEALGGTVRLHEVFQTAAVLFREGLRLDLATARSEHYRGPAALPDVSPGDIRQDLSRRDFTINTLAMPLTPSGFGRLLDFFGGRKDLRDGKIRVLHRLSFIEDPTRAFRALRFATTLGFHVSRETAHLIRVATRERVFDRLSPVRLRREVEQLLGGPRPATAVRMLAEHRLLAFLHPHLQAARGIYGRLERAGGDLSWHRRLDRGDAILEWAVILGVLAEGLDDRARVELLERLRPGRRALRILREGPEGVHRTLSRLTGRRATPPSLIFEVCRGELPETLLMAMASTRREAVRRRISLYLSQLRDVRPDIRGTDLIRAGVPEGPRVAAGLKAALFAKLDGRAPDPPSQLRAALSAAAKA